MPTELPNLSKAAKTTATTAATGFAIANPLMTAFIVGIGLAIWLTLRTHGRANV